MEYEQPQRPEDPNYRTTNIIGEQYLNSVVGNPRELTDNKKNKKQRRKGWPVAAVILVIVLAMLLAVVSGSTVFLNKRLRQLEEVVAQNHPGSVSTSSTDSNKENSSKPDDDELPSGVSYTENGTQEKKDVYDVIQNSMKTVVSIDTMEETVYGTTALGSGSGVIFSEDGYIITCDHVVEGANKIYVFLDDGTSYEAQLLHEDSVSDLAIIKIDASDLPYVKFADSDTVYIGEEVFAIGNMLGELSNSCTRGCISGINRSVSVQGMMMTLLQTDAAINHGNSGGALFRESDGSLVGIVNAKSDAANVENLGFAIPSNDVAKVISDLLEKGYVTERPYLGVATKDVHLTGYGLLSYFYVYPKVVSVDPNSPAARAGIKVDDIILEIDGQSIGGKNALASVLYSHSVGDTIKIVVRRGDSDMEFNVTLVEYTGDNN